MSPRPRSSRRAERTRELRAEGAEPRGLEGFLPGASTARAPVVPGWIGALLALALCAGACSTPARASGTPSTPADESVSPLNVPLLASLQQALEQGEDELAGRLIARLRTRTLSTAEERAVAAAERVLFGRARVRELDLALESEPASDAPEGAFSLWLVARSRSARPVTLALPPADLKRARAAIDANGLESLEYESTASRVLCGLALAPGGEQRIELLRYELPCGRALAVRERWRLESRSGDLLYDGASYPAARVPVRGCSRERVSPLVAGPEAPGSTLAEVLSGGEALTPRQVLEVALRIPREEREAALRPLGALVEGLPQERIQAVEPALRWLTGNRDIGPDGPRWARYLAARAELGAEPEEGERPALDLPARPVR